MRRDVLKLLDDIRVAAASIQEYTEGMTEAGYRSNKPIRRAVEREFEIIGEALRRLVAQHPDVGARIPQAGPIIGFRKVLPHGYDAIVDERVWNTVVTEIPELLQSVQALMAEERRDQPCAP